MPTAKISQRAYEIWEQEGRPEGRDMDHWLKAEAEVAVPAAAPKAPAAKKPAAPKAAAAKPAAKPKAPAAKKPVAAKKPAAPKA